MTVEIKTIYELHKDQWDQHASSGMTAVVEATKRFTNYADMERAIGYSNSNVKKWAYGTNISPRSERMAAAWINGTKLVQAAPQPSSSSDEMFLVVTPAGSADKVRRVLAMLGCEFEAM